jgi:cell division protein FtsL
VKFAIVCCLNDAFNYSFIQEKLLEQQSKAGTDEFIESIAREKLGMVKPGERLFVDSE